MLGIPSDLWFPLVLLLLAPQCRLDKPFITSLDFLLDSIVVRNEVFELGLDCPFEFDVFLLIQGAWLNDLLPDVRFFNQGLLLEVVDVAMQIAIEGPLVFIRGHGLLHAHRFLVELLYA